MTAKTKKSLQEINPELAVEFDLSKNGGLTASDFSPGSDKKVWWKAGCGHSWEASVGHRVRGRGCPVCKGMRVIAGINDLTTTHPSLAKEFDVLKNAPLEPTMLSAGSNKKVWWTGNCGHAWETTVAHRSKGTGCPVCDGKVVIEGQNDLATTHPNIAKYWSAKNLPLKSTSVHAGTPKKAWFHCDFGHEYETAVNSKTRLNLGCPICSLKVLVAGVNDLATTHPQIAGHWNKAKNVGLSPSDVSIGSKRKIWFTCDNGHDYEQQISSSLKYGCNKCSGHTVSRGENDLATLRPDLAAEWNFDLNDKSPSDVMLGSDYRAWWIDQENHIWQQGVQVRSRGVGCPKCAQLGYDKTSPGLLYLIRHAGYGARKIGITNLESRFDRVQGFKELGWTTVATYNDDNGAIILDTETRIFQWIRKELGLPQYLGKSDMGRMGGNSETFSGEGISDGEVKKKIELTLKSVRDSYLSSSASLGVRL